IFTERDALYRACDGDGVTADRARRTLVREVMSQPVKTVRRQQSLAEAIERMVREGCRHLVVVDRNGALKGLLTTNDLIQFVTERFPEETVNLPPRLHQRYLTPEGA
ncbi:MAG TPA: CBS domain-containing protein, partial [Candidatus Polarisedimenticolaceae bacterium]|nr:CBS domain-containing protein [Candidatus Polarisedimenticolaceae bacterium]